MARGRPRKPVPVVPVLDVEAADVMCDVLNLVYDRLFPLQDKIRDVREEVELYTDNRKAQRASIFLDDVFGQVVEALTGIEQAKDWIQKGVIQV